MTTWILNANASEAKLFSIENLQHIEQSDALELTQSFSHKESRQKDEDLSSDRLGNRHGSVSGSGNYEAASEPKQNEALLFAQELAEVLEQGRVQNHYEQLIVVASPHFLGLLNSAMNDQIKQMISHSIDKDYHYDTLPNFIVHLMQHL